MKFKVTYVTGLIEEVVQSDVDSIEGFINSKFGITHDEVCANGTKIEIVDADGEPVAEVVADEPAAEETPAA